MKFFTDERGIPRYEPDTAEEWLQEIFYVAADYDGFNTVESLKYLIDELVEMSQNARQCLREGKIFPDDMEEANTNE